MAPLLAPLLYALLVQLPCVQSGGSCALAMELTDHEVEGLLLAVRLSHTSQASGRVTPSSLQWDTGIVTVVICWEGGSSAVTSCGKGDR